jgi:replicative superfamily II helicase
MVDFKKRLAKKDGGKVIDPIAIYETLDRASDKGPLRPAQEAILRTWHQQRRNERDLILKLHTGQGKTVVGLLMLQSKLNEIGGRALYLCPNNYLINQTCEQARQFGFRFCIADPELPHEFLDGKAILITVVQKLFNGLTKFRLGPQALPVTALVMDDSHACIDEIRDSFTIKLPRTHVAYGPIVDLFAGALENQGLGTFADIKNANHDAILPVPYWEWADKLVEVTGILSKHAEHEAIKFVWPLLRDSLGDCQCVVSGDSLEIQPYVPPLDLFATYYKAMHRTFMSATVTDDSFLVKGLRLNPATIRQPLVYDKERWSGEKMVLIPSLIDAINRDTVITAYGAQRPGRKYGVVVLTRSFNATKGWEVAGANVAKKMTIEGEIDGLRAGNCNRALVIVNRYDGIDLPDDMCRVLILDSTPYSESLIDRYEESCRATSDITSMRMARTIEQGMGRSVRGEKDYCVIILIGEDLVKTVRAPDTRKHLSAQTRTQIDIGLEIAEMARQDEKDAAPLDILRDLVNQCLKRDPDWKAFYAEQMDAVEHTVAGGKALDMFEMELAAETASHQGDPAQAARIIQDLIDKHVTDDADKGWYIQQMARYTYHVSNEKSNALQLEAHKKNRFLMKPQHGMRIDTIIVSQQRVGNIITWMKRFGCYADLLIELDDILGRLAFGVKADRFERAFDELGRALGFSTQRPDKEWKAGPDNLWALRDGEYLLVECKSEVHSDRKEIFKEETGQMNNACAWFATHYKGAKAKNIMINPASKLANAAGFTEEVQIMQKGELTKLTKNVQRFFAEFASADFKDLSDEKVQALLDAHHLSVDSLLTDYSRAPRT